MKSSKLMEVPFLSFWDVLGSKFPSLILSPSPGLGCLGLPFFKIPHFPSSASQCNQATRAPAPFGPPSKARCPGCVRNVAWDDGRDLPKVANHNWDGAVSTHGKNQKHQSHTYSYPESDSRKTTIPNSNYLSPVGLCLISMGTTDVTIA